jgi:hypothetical protein
LWHDDDRFVAVGGILAARRLAVDQYVAAVEPLLDAAAGKLRHQAGDDLVEPLAAGAADQVQGNRRQAGIAGAGVDDVEFLIEVFVQQRVNRKFRRVRRWR